MNIAGRNDRLAQLISEGYDLLIYINKILSRINILMLLIGDHILIIAQRLYLKIIIELSYPDYILFASSLHYCTVQLPRLTSRTYDKPLSVLLQYALGYSLVSVKILKMGLGYQPVKIYPSDLVLGQDYHVIGHRFFNYVNRFFPEPAKRIKILNTSVLNHLNQLHKDFCRTFGVLHGPVMILKRNL